MKINLDQVEIQTALAEYITNQGINLKGKSVDVTLIAGRGENGHSAIVDISQPVVTSDSEESTEPQQAVTFDFIGED